MDYADKLRPGMNQTKRRLIHDALELESLCGKIFRRDDASDASSMRELRESNIPTFYVDSVSGSDENDARESDASSMRELRESNIPTFYVDSVSGSDENEGTFESKPLRSVHVALKKSRLGRSPERRIVLRDGMHRLNETVKLLSSDSGLIITSYPGEQAVVSGGKLLTNLTWTLEDDRIYKTKIDHLKELRGDMLALHHRGQRVTLARYPNANPELDLFPIGYITSDTSWTPPVNQNGETCDPNLQCGTSENITIPATDAWHGMFQNYSIGRGGACDRYDPNVSPWCSGDFYLLRQFPEMHTRSPSGIDNAMESLPNSPYNSSEFYIHSWRPGHWYVLV